MTKLKHYTPDPETGVLVPEWSGTRHSAYALADGREQHVGQWGYRLLTYEEQEVRELEVARKHHEVLARTFAREHELASIEAQYQRTGIPPVGGWSGWKWGDYPGLEDPYLWREGEPVDYFKRVLLRLAEARDYHKAEFEKADRVWRECREPQVPIGASANGWTRIT